MTSYVLYIRYLALYKNYIIYTNSNTSQNVTSNFLSLSLSLSLSLTHTHTHMYYNNVGTESVALDSQFLAYAVM